MRVNVISFMCALAGIVLLAGCGMFSSSGNGASHEGANREELTIRIAHVAESGGDLNAAERFYKQAVAQSGNAVSARLELADFYKRHNREPEAIEILNETAKLQPENADALRALGNSYINAGMPDKALECLNKAIAVTSKEPLLYNSKGIALDMQTHYADAQMSYLKALTLDPANGTMYASNLSMSYILSGEYNKAITLLLPLLDAADVTPNIRQNLALAYGLKGESGKALKLGLKDLTAKEAEENLKFYRMMGNNKKRKDAPSEAEPSPPPLVTQQSAPVTPVAVNTESPPAAKSADAAPPAVFELPLPVLKPDNLTAR